MLSNAFQLQFLLFFFCAFAMSSYFISKSFTFLFVVRYASGRVFARRMTSTFLWHSQLKSIKSPWHHNRMKHIIDLIDPKAEFNPIRIAQCIAIHQNHLHIARIIEMDWTPKHDLESEKRWWRKNESANEHDFSITANHFISSAFSHLLSFPFLLINQWHTNRFLHFFFVPFIFIARSHSGSFLFISSAWQGYGESSEWS